MHTLTRSSILGLLTVAILGSTAGSTHAQPTTRRVLADVTISGVGPAASLQITFEFPVRYLRHFPAERGHELRIALRPLVINPADQEALLGREAVASFEYDDRVPVKQINYEGDIPGGPFLTVEFDRAVTYRITQGQDFRSIRIDLPGPRRSQADAAPPTGSSKNETNR